MKIFLLALALLMQAGPQGVGVVTGVVRGANGMPASGVRVYAIGVRDSLEALKTGTAPLEGLTQTDASGRYRLEVAPGRYYVASGSVNSPTFYPGTANAADARVVTVASGGLVEAIDFSSFVPASRSPVGGAFPMGTGILSGVLRFPDGTAAAGFPIVGISAASVTGGGPAAAFVGQILQTLQPIQLPLVSAPPGTSPGFSILVAPPTPIPPLQAPRLIVSSGWFYTTTDATGRYRFPNLPADTFYIVAGYAESPTLYPGVTDLPAAQTIATTPTTNVNTLDFTVPLPPSAGVTVRGRVTAMGNSPLDGIRVDMVAPPPSPSQFGLPSINPNRFVNSGPDGSFEFPGVRPGSYRFSAAYSGHSDGKNIVIADQPVENLDFILRAAPLSGRILDENGSPIPDARLFSDVVVSTVSNPNIVKSTILSVGSNGSFNRILEPEEYRFFLRALPEEYSIHSITAGGVDLVKQTLKFTGNEPVSVDVRVAKRTPTSDLSTVLVKGRMTDALSGAPSAGERITLCCRESGPVERFSAPLKPDGSFEFAAVPPGRYSVGLQAKTGTPNLFVVPRDIVAEQGSIAGLELFSTPQLTEMSARLVLENGSALPEDLSATVVFTGTRGRVRVEVASRRRDGTYTAQVPAGEGYTVSVVGLSEGYSVKSVDNLMAESLRVANPTGTLPGPSPIIITLTQSR